MINTPRYDALAEEALECCIGDLPFDKALELCKELELEVEKLKLSTATIKPDERTRAKYLDALNEAHRSMVDCLVPVSYEKMYRAEEELKLSMKTIRNFS